MLTKTYKCYTRWRKEYLICLCKVGNPACDRYKSCEVNEFELQQYKDIKKCMEHSSYKRIKKAIRQTRGDGLDGKSTE